MIRYIESRHITKAAITIIGALMLATSPCSVVQAAQLLAKTQVGNVQVSVVKSNTQNTAAALNKNSKEIKTAQLETAAAMIRGKMTKVVDFTVSVDLPGEGFIHNVTGAGINIGHLLANSDFKESFSRLPVYGALTFRARVKPGKMEPVARFFEVGKGVGVQAPNLHVVINESVK